MKMIKLLCRTLPFILLTLAMAGSAIGAKKSSGGQYTSPLGNFSLPVPICDPGSVWPARVCPTRQQDGDDIVGGVSFLDDFGTLWGITYLRISPDIQEMVDDPVQSNITLRNFLHERLLPEMFKPASPNATILHEEFLDPDGQGELLAIVDLPEGSHMVTMVWPGPEEKRLDSTRAVLIFKVGEFMYVLHHELKNVFNRKDFLFDDIILERERESLQRFKGTIEFNVTLPE